MARKADRGGLATRARIASIASELFARDGFEGVTVSDVARAAGVSSVTVFKYFPKKEDLFFDRADEISADVLTALAHLATRADIREGLARLFEDLADRRHPLSGLDPRSVGFFGEVAASATLTARARQLAWEFQAELEELLRRSGFGGDARMAAALIVAGYTSVLVSSAARLAAGLPDGELLAQHRDQTRQLLRALDAGLF